jgi:CRISPR/Cas system-associated exonuclease Cas4 (RecB family)
MANLESWFFKYNAWSYSKHRLFGLCKKNYYYRYIGTALKESSKFDIHRLKILKNLNSKFALQGILIHEIIENQINQHHLGREVNEEGAKKQFVQRVEKYREMARETLIEYYNGESIEHPFFDRARSDGQDKISMFFGAIWPQFKELQYLRHEEFDKFKIQDVEVIVKIDYITKTKNDTLVISDWKTGANNEEYESDLQIGTYVLWAMQYYNKSPQEIRSELVYLTTGMMPHYEFSIEQLEEIKRKIVEDYEKMNATYEIEDYPSDPEPRKCLSCQFGTICPDSKMKEQLGRVNNGSQT